MFARWFQTAALCCVIGFGSVLPLRAAILNVPADHGTIQAAIDAASAGDTILVAAGTYDESVRVTKAVTLQGARAGTPGDDPARGSGESVIDSVTSAGGLAILASNATVDGFVIEDCDSGSYGCGVYLSPATSGVAVANNVIRNNTFGLYLGASGAATTTISRNLFDGNNRPGPASGDAIYSDVSVREVVIDQNRFQNVAVSAMVLISEIYGAYGPVSNLEFTNNTVLGAGIGISGQAYAYGGSRPTNLVVSGNTFDGLNTRATACRVLGVDNAQIVNNEVRNYTAPGGAGLQVGYLSVAVMLRGNLVSNCACGTALFNWMNGADVTVLSNSYTGNTVNLRQNDLEVWPTLTALNANGNWLGATAETTVAGQVEGTVDFSPWLGSGTDLSGAPGFQGDFANLWVGHAGADTGTLGRVQEGVNLVRDGGTVHVSPGTYAESPAIGSPLSLVGEGGRDQVNLALQTGPTYLGALTVTAGPTVIEGLTITGRDAVADGLASSNVLIGLPTPVVTVRDCRLKVGSIGSGSNGDDGFGLLTTYGTATGVGSVTMTGNLIEPVLAQGQRAFFVNPGIASFTFTGNTISGRFASTSYAQAQDFLIEGNTVTGTGAAGSRSAGLGVLGYPDPAVWGHGVFRNNTISNTAAAIRLYSAQNVVVERNNLFANDRGITVADYQVASDPATLDLRQNRIVQSQVFAVDNALTGSVKAENNWWGSHSPASLCNGTVDSDPWVKLGLTVAPLAKGEAPYEADLTADLTKNSAGATVALGALLDGLTATFQLGSGGAGNIPKGSATQQDTQPLSAGLASSSYAAPVPTSAGVYPLVVTCDGATADGSFTVTGGSGGATYPFTVPAGRQFVSAPVILDATNARPLNVLGFADDAAMAAAGVTLQRYDTNTRVWYTYPSVPVTTPATDPAAWFSFTSGQGLWVTSPAGISTALTGEVKPPSEPLTVPLIVGQNHAGNPYDVKMRWDPSNIEVYEGTAMIGRLSDSSTWTRVSPYIYLWEGGRLRLKSTAVDVPWKAGFVMTANRPGITLKVLSAGYTTRSRAVAPDLSNWQVGLTAQLLGDTAASDALIGVNAGVTRSLAMAVPDGNPPTGVDLAVITADVSRAAAELHAPASRQVFDLVATSQAAGTVVLSWGSLFRTTPRGLVLELVDLQTGQTTLLNTRSTYSYSAGRAGEERRFQVRSYVGNLDRAAITSLSVTPTRGGGAALTLTLSGPGEVTLTVRGLSGKVVKQVASQTSGAGTVTVVWDGTDASGRDVPRGSYVVEAVAVSANGASSRAVRTVAVN